MPEIQFVRALGRKLCKSGMRVRNMVMLATFAIGLAITMAIGTALGMVDHSHIAFASSSGGSSTPGASG